MQIKIMELESSFSFPSFLDKCTVFLLQTARKQTKAGPKMIWSCNECATSFCLFKLFPNSWSHKQKLFITTGVRQWGRNKVHISNLKWRKLHSCYLLALALQGRVQSTLEITEATKWKTLSPNKDEEGMQWSLHTITCPSQGLQLTPNTQTNPAWKGGWDQKRRSASSL